jgi:hypothetical protein
MKESELKQLFAHLEDSAVAGQFSSWSLGKKSNTGEIFASGFYADEASDPIFDLASLTKPLFLGVLCRALAQGKFAGWLQLPFSDSIFDSIPEVFRADLLKNPQLTPYHLLNHQAGFKSWFWFGKGLWHFNEPANTSTKLKIANCLFPEDSLNKIYQIKNLKHTLWRSAFETKLDNSENKFVYSDVGYFVLTQVLEWVFLGTESQEDFWKKNLLLVNDIAGNTEIHKLSHCQLSHSENETSQRLAPYFPYSILDTSLEPETDMDKFGACHDTNANILARAKSWENGGAVMSLHAGLFGDIQSVCYAAEWLRKFDVEFFPAAQDYSSGTEAKFWRGFDMPSGLNSIYSPQTWPLLGGDKLLGHLGYTGTSMCFNSIASLSLLVNRTSGRTFHAREDINLKKTRCIKVEKNGQFQFFLSHCKNGSSNLQEISESNFHDLRSEFFRAGKKVWNCNSLTPANNIAELRRKTAQILWKTLESEL